MDWQPVDLTTDPHEVEYRGDPAELVDAFEEILSALARPAWQARAACRGKGPAKWFPSPGKNGQPSPETTTAAGKAICATCPVQEECLDFALENDATGTWGGVSLGTKRSLRPLRRAA